MTRILGLCKNDRQRDALVQFIKFGIVGVSNTAIGYAIYAISLLLLRRWKLFPEKDYFVAQFIMFVLSVAWSFFWNNRFVFREREGEQRNILTALLKAYASYAFTSLFLNELLLYLWVDRVGLSEYIAPLLNLIITVPMNFLIQKFWTFSDHKQ